VTVTTAIAIEAAGACVTIRAMPRVLLVLLILFVAPACQQAQASRNGLSAADREVDARVDALEHQLHTIRKDQARLSRADKNASRQMATLAHRLDATATVLDRIKTKLGELRSKVDGAVSQAGQAASEASQATARAAALAQRLAVLEKRFDYHLRHDPGAQ
jgi:chromosome segregation ATPase